MFAITVANYDWKVGSFNWRLLREADTWGTLLNPKAIHKSPPRQRWTTHLFPIIPTKQISCPLKTYLWALCPLIYSLTNKTYTMNWSETDHHQAATNFNGFKCFEICILLTNKLAMNKSLSSMMEVKGSCLWSVFKVSLNYQTQTLYKLHCTGLPITSFYQWNNCLEYFYWCTYTIYIAC